MKTKRIIIPVSVLILALIAGGLYLYIHGKNTPQAINSGGPSQAEIDQRKKTETDQKKDFIENSNTENATPLPVPSDSSGISIEVQKSSNNEATVVTKLKGYASGTCELKISNGSNNYTDSAKVIYQPEYSTCAGFSVPISKVGSGTWVIDITVVSSDGSSQSKQIQQKI